MSDLKDFLYLDTTKLHSFIAQIGGGIADEVNVTTEQQGGVNAALAVGLLPAVGKIGADKQVKNEHQKILKQTDPANFATLYNHLESNKLISKITDFGLDKRQKLKVGQFVEIKGLAEPPAVESWISNVKELMNFFEKNMKLLGQLQPKSQVKNKTQNTNTLSKQQMDAFKGILNFLEDYIRISRKDPGKQFIRVIGNKQIYYVWCGLIPNHVLSPLETVLPAEVTIIGRVEKLLSDGESYKIVDFSNFQQSNVAFKFLDALNGLSTVIGQKEIKEKDLQAESPDIFVTPIAIYQ